MDYAEHLVPAADGTQLYARDYAADRKDLAPIVCLPGLTRNSRDFETIAPRLAETRRVLAFDFRGRGRSGRADPATYRPDQEVADTLHVLDSLGIDRFAIIGTSRGGICAMAMAARALPRMAGVVFNDIGPKIDKAGLLRIRSYLGADPRFAGWDAAVAALKSSNPGFGSLSEDEWLAFARRVHREVNGKPRADYDPALARNFPSAAQIEAGQVPELWALLDVMADVPSLVLRGEHSDLLSPATVAAMHQRHRRLDSATVRDRGHVPFLDEPESVAAIDRWLKAVDGYGTTS
ncbi:MAG: alpha/beta hydrolase [Aestuariivirga sp.]|uniref:alpha/beta fold hydrolase n=1 Tax=Aestuariivirga sp. TaxID=2650926 RepID=UPI0025BE8E35|nr:alpha/beta hydrolase [Aestuariivirga sp.]MCA3560657.1 alpha/beta hydrolase [Aestuariivirga sp.]